MKGVAIGWADTSLGAAYRPPQRILEVACGHRPATSGGGARPHPLAGGGYPTGSHLFYFLIFFKKKKNY